MYSPRQKILWFALCSRIFLICFQCFTNLLIPDHDAGVFMSPEQPELVESTLDVIILTILGGFKRWDAQYFLHIAQYGYTYENCLAFFPLYPLCVRYITQVLHHIFGGWINIQSLLLVSAITVNILFFIKSVDALHQLSLKVLRSESRAYKAAILYCVNPASIFFSAPYSESLFAWLTFYSMSKCIEEETLRFSNIDVLSSLPVGLTMITRSNGILNLGFIIYASFKNLCEKTLPEIYYKFKSMQHYFLTPVLLLPLITTLMALFLTILISSIPFLLVQVYNYFKFCQPHDHNLPKFLEKPQWVLPGQADSPWCNSSLPLAYSYVQSHYWDVGFLKYYQWKQLPNFILAFPIVYLILYHSYLYIRHNFRHCLRIGLKNPIFKPSIMPPKRSHRKFTTTSNLYDQSMFVYIVHGVALTLFCVVCVHIQVTTRLICSASPILYWVCSGVMDITPNPISDQNNINEHFRRMGISKRTPSHHLSIANLEGLDNMYSKWRTFIVSKNMPNFHSRLIQYYFLGYYFIGTVLFSNYYPWT